jgi:hypothetical protein
MPCGPAQTECLTATQMTDAIRLLSAWCALQPVAIVASTRAAPRPYLDKKEKAETDLKPNVHFWSRN